MDQPELLASAEAQLDHTQYKTVVTSRSHSIIADEPADLGGSDSGMTPYELLLSSLSSCTAITLQMYINRKMWIVDEIKISQRLYRVDKDTTIIKTELNFKGELTAEQEKRLEQIARACPVHKILSGNISISTAIN